MEEENEKVVEETTQETTEQVDESKFESAGDDSVIKVDLSKPPKPVEENEKPTDNKQTEEVQGIQNREQTKEDRKDERTKIQATQQSEMIDQRTKDKPPRNFESKGNDILGGINLGM